MFKKVFSKLSSILKPTPEVLQARAYLKYLKSSYPHNHNYKVRRHRLIPTRELSKRYKRIRELFPDPLTSFLDIGSCKGFFVFAASEHPECTRSLGIDVHQYDIDVCLWLKKRLNNTKVQFEYLRLHEFAERIDEFGGPFQTVLISNMYQYLYFGSVRSPDRYLNHDEIFKNLRKICNERLIFNNRVHLADCQNADQIDTSGEFSQNYSEEKILEAASKHFKVVPHGFIGKYPLWTLDVKETAASFVSSEELKEVFDRWINDMTFRDEFKKNPEKALHDAGFNFPPEKLQKIKVLLKQQTLKNEELSKRLTL